MSLRSASLSLIFLVVAGIAGRAQATMVLALSLSAMTRQADHVFVGQVIDEQSLYESPGRIVTDVRIQVMDPVKGTLVPGAAVTVRRLGGVVGDVGMRVLGEPSFIVGERVVMFAEWRGGTSELSTVGMSQGALQVYEDAGQTWVRSAAREMSAVERAPNGALVRAQLAVPSARPLASLLDEVRALASAAP